MVLRVGLFCAVASWAIAPALARTDQGASQPAPATSSDQVAAQADSTDIVVTANRRPELLQDVPLSVTAIRGDELRARGVSNPEDLIRVAPTLSVQNTGGNVSGTNFSIRGIGTSSFQRSVEPSVAIVLDDVTLIRSDMGMVNLADVSQVEVLNGPQGFLFGKNASAGLVNIRTNEPQIGRNTGRFLAEYGVLNTSNDTSLFRAQGIANVAIADKAAIRLNVFHVRNAALMENVVPNANYNADLRQIGGSASVLWNAMDNLTVLLAGDYMDSDGAGSAVSSVRSVTPVSPLGAILGSLGVQPGLDNTEVAYDAPVDFQYKVGGARARVAYEFDSGLTLTNIAAYRTFKQLSMFDADFSPLSLIEKFPGRIKAEQFSNELRVTSPTGGRLEYQAGAYFLTGKVREAAELEASLGMPPFPGFQTNLGTDSFFRQKLGSYAVFGQGTYTLSDRLKLSLGTRLTHETINMKFEVTAGKGAIPLLAPLSPVADESRSETNLSGRGTLQFDIHDDWMVYGTAARGYKGPGYQQYSFNYVQPEISTHFELGSKAQFLNRKVTLNVAAYDTAIKDFQAQSARLDGPTVLFLLQNAGKLRTRGAEVQLLARPTRQLTISGGAAYTDAKFLSFEGDICYPGQPGCVNGLTDSSGNRLPNAPRWKGVLDVGYEQPITRSLSALFNVGVTSTSKYNFLSNGDPIAVQKGYTAFDLTAGLTSSKMGWTVRAFCRNCTDQRVHAMVQQLNLFVGDAVQVPTYQGYRQLGLGLDVNF